MPTFEETLRAYQEEGTLQKAASRLGVVTSTVSVILRKNGFQPGKSMPRVQYDPQQVCEDYKRLKDSKAVARIHGIHPTRVTQILRGQFGIGRGEGMTDLQALPIEEVVSRYQSGESCAKIGKSYGVSWSCVRENLVKAGHELRDRKEAAPRGEAHAHWKGGAYVHNHRKTRAAAEAYVGRKLLRGVVVHHQDENTLNNDPSNLWVFPNQSFHTGYHQSLLRHQRSGVSANANLLALGSGGRPLLKSAYQTVAEHATGLLALFETEPTPDSVPALF